MFEDFKRKFKILKEAYYLSDINNFYVEKY